MSSKVAVYDITFGKYILMVTLRSQTLFESVCAETLTVCTVQLCVIGCHDWDILSFS